MKKDYYVLQYCNYENAKALTKTLKKGDVFSVIMLKCMILLMNKIDLGIHNLKIMAGISDGEWHY